MKIKLNCDICEKVIITTPTVAHKINTDGLLILCKGCWVKKGLFRDRYTGQIQDGYFLANN